MSDNRERVSFPFHLGGPGIMTADKQFSIYVSKTLDCLGYNQDMVKYRVKMYRELLEHLTDRPLESIVVAGSKAGGLTSVYESDLDVCFYLMSYVPTLSDHCPGAPPSAAARPPPAHNHHHHCARCPRR